MPMFGFSPGIRPRWGSNKIESTPSETVGEGNDSSTKPTKSKKTGENEISTYTPRREIPKGQPPKKRHRASKLQRFTPNGVLFGGVRSGINAYSHISERVQPKPPQGFLEHFKKIVSVPYIFVLSVGVGAIDTVLEIPNDIEEAITGDLTTDTPVLFPISHNEFEKETIFLKCSKNPWGGLG